MIRSIGAVGGGILKDGLYGCADAEIDLGSKGGWIGASQMFGFWIGHGLFKGLGVKYLLDKGQDRHEIMMTGIPVWIRRFQIELARFGVHVRIVDWRSKENFGIFIDIVVGRRELQSEFENPIGKGAAADKDHSVKQAQIVHGRNEVDATRSVRF